jgi:hypothetical protein
MGAIPAGASATATAAPSSLSFGTFAVGTSGPLFTTVNVTCSSSSELGCLIDGHFSADPLLSGANPEDFSQSHNCPSMGVAHDDPIPSCTFTVRFAPTAAGARSATLRLGFEDSGVGSAPVSVPLAGEGAIHSTGPLPPAKPKAKCKRKKRAAAARKKCKRKGRK